MKKFSYLLIALALLTFAGCKSNATSSGPTKDAAVQTLRAFLAAVEAKDYDKAAGMLKLPPQVTSDDIKKGLGRILELQEISSKGIDIIADKGKWGKLEEVFGADRANRFVERSGVSLNDSYGLSYQDAEAAFFWDGQQFKITRVNNIGKLQ
jgi:hypothetical protein